MRYTYLWLAAVGLLSGFSSMGQCDPNIRTVAGDALTKYGPRGNRCEGEYIRKVSSPPGLEVVGFVQGRNEYALTPSEIIELSVVDPNEDLINIRAVAIPLTTHYQMDAQLKPFDTLKWPVRDVLYRMQLSHAKIGVYGWKGEGPRKTFFLVRTKSSIGAPTDAMTLVLRTYSDIRSVRWSYSRIENNKASAPSAPVLLKDYLRADTSFSIRLPDDFRGTYVLEIRALEGMTNNTIIQPIRICTER